MRTLRENLVSAPHHCFIFNKEKSRQPFKLSAFIAFGGSWGIRTPGTVARTSV